DGFQATEMLLELADGVGTIGFRLREHDAAQRTARGPQPGSRTAHLIPALQLELIQVVSHAVHALSGCHAHRSNDSGNESDDYEAKNQLHPYRQTVKPVHRINNPSKKQERSRHLITVAAAVKQEPRTRECGMAPRPCIAALD